MLLLWGLCFCNQSRGRVESGEREKRKRKRKGNGGGRMGQVTIALNAIPPWYVPAKRNNMCHFEDVHTCIFFKTRYRSKLCFTVHVTIPNSQFHPTKYTALPNQRFPLLQYNSDVPYIISFKKHLKS